MFGSMLLLLIKNMSIPPSGDLVRRSCANLIVHAPTVLDSRIRGLYQSTLPDGQREIVAWDDGQKKTHYNDGTYPGKCDTVLSANLLTLDSGQFVDWDLHDLSEANNDIGHTNGQDNLGLEQCSARIYTVAIKNTSASDGDLVLGNADTDRWSGFLEAEATLTLPPNSIFVLASEDVQGMPVGAGNSNLRAEASGGDVLMGLNYNGCSV